ncbi:MAG: hypothetical protein IKF72_15710 [Kiritimatiellae bacterium]|nr:hypothetical protein [Kiritimatiellia bacterium]
MKQIFSMACAFCAAFGLAVSATAGNVTLTWDASANPLPTTLGDAATGLLEFTYDPGNASVVSNITAHPVDGGTIVMTGDQIDLCSLPHVIMADVGELVFSNAVNGAANIYCESTVQNYNTISYSGANFDTEYRTIFANQNLDDWMPYETGNAGGKGWWKTDGIKTYNIRHETDGSLTAQRQADLGSGLMGIVKFQLKQNGANIDGRVIYAGYWNKTKGPVGTDSDDVIANPVKYGEFTNQGVSTPTKDSGYGINKITMYRVKGLPTVRFAGGLDIVQVLYARGFTHVIYERAVTGSAKLGYQADANGILTFRDPDYLFDPSAKAGGGKLSDFGLKGSGTIEFEATDALSGDETYDTFTLSSAPWIPTSWITIATNKLLKNLLDVTAVFGGASIGGDYRTRVPVQLLDIADDGQTATAQFHQLGSYNTGVTNRICAVLVELRQNGDDVQMMASGAAYYNGSGYAALYGKDMSAYKGNGSVSVTVDNAHGSYGVHDLSLTFRSVYNVKCVTMGWYPGIRNMEGSTAVPGCKAQLIVKGTNNTRMRYVPSAANGHVLPATDGLLRIQNGGDVVQTKAQNSYATMWVDDSALIYIEEGGVFKQQTYWGLGYKQKIDIMGGEFRAYDVSTAPQGQLVLNLFTLSGDVYFHSIQGRSGDMVRAGYKQDAVWTVRGASPSSFELPLSLWGAAEEAAGGNTMTFAVNDVTGDSATDFTMNGAISLNAGEPDILGVYKTGPGTMQLNASYNISGKTTLLKDGTWLLNGSSLTSASDPYTIDGGTLAVADGTANSMGVLTVGAAGGGITLGSGATLTFADSSAAEWAAGENIVITGFAEKSIRIGTDVGALTREQRRRLRTSDNRRLYLGYDGFLTTTSNSTRIYIR